MILSARCEAPRRRGAQAAALAAALALSAGAHAQTSDGDRVTAEALFKSARELVEKGDYAAGCPKFEASFALHASASTMLNIARCHEHDGKLATAWSNYRQALVLNRETVGKERQKVLDDIAQQGVAALEPRLPKLQIGVTGAAREGLTVLRDGTALPVATLGEALPADPGKHQVTVSAPGFRTETRAVDLAEGRTTRVDVTLVADAGAAPPAGNAAGNDEGGVPTWAWISGGAGIVLLGTGIYFLTDDLGAISALRDHCREQGSVTSCDAGYDYASDNARKNRGFGLFVGLGGAGAAALGAAAYGIATAGPSNPRSDAARVTAVPWIGPGTLGAGVSGGF